MKNLFYIKYTSASDREHKKAAHQASQTFQSIKIRKLILCIFVCQDRSAGYFFARKKIPR